MHPTLKTLAVAFVVAQAFWMAKYLPDEDAKPEPVPAPAPESPKP